jgi:hypothetical protein
MLRSLGSVIACAMIAGCAHTTPEPKGLAIQQGERVTLVGEAQSRKMGGAVLGDGFYVWLDERQSFPFEVIGKQVSVTGVWDVRHDLPVFVMRPGDTNVPQGIPVPPGTNIKKASQRIVIKDSTWELVRAQSSE